MKTHFSDIAATTQDLMLPCFNKQIFGVDCPGCGLQRSALLLFQGEFAAAFQMFPGILPMLLLFGFLLADQFFKFRHANKISIVLMFTTVAFILGNFAIKLST